MATYLALPLDGTFWWSNGLGADIIMLSFGFLEDTYYYRGSEAERIVLCLRRIFREQLVNVLLETSDCIKSIKQRND